MFLLRQEGLRALAFPAAYLIDVLSLSSVLIVRKHAFEHGKTRLESVLPLIKIEAWLVYFLYTKSIHFLYLTTLVYIFSIHQIYIKQNFVL